MGGKSGVRDGRMDRWTPGDPRGVGNKGGVRRGGGRVGWGQPGLGDGATGYVGKRGLKTIGRDKGWVGEKDGRVEGRVARWD